ncbi:hypothetical protein A3D66_01375 [Candidatus Kaiserbacteria bacterium RIFCSPHIGHO2_02_FULL_50_9]|uniref:Uncharacterized protein n=1 Tax=Candidatus Kaiserbacteria bacterium RIFCSPLOWO2_01_FULL_51_21 TaxID=1798508 RepID=A0A1F6ECP9_9BACT|nr:MAG: hypothetical protein A2761_01025 [Candidatus Kaiserbacteria bacterium RIFCSPHIGHO2_01_FULL_51_33]OGG63295.1 MAG: hypothetical protein A3D66_01375 [Candidatus Kaiserbacteria bacterium RIFCSPHIGHO2_02_FULL_50_9]OGG71449.1 MAG: hypothetical protein A3A35_03325 [Candidatus Kaiserbacteria bacterium RIFCSPLOWO2_01_FULL_51_21]
MLKGRKKIILGAVGVIVLFMLYTFFFTGGETPGTSPLVEESIEGNVAIGEDLVALLLQLQSIRLDPTVFNDPAFRSLRDFGQPIPDEPVGRPNPFAPLQ